MIKRTLFHKSIVLLICWIAFSFPSYASFVQVCGAGISTAAPKPGQKAKKPYKRILGVVRDVNTNEILPFVNVFCKQYKKGVTTDLNGVFNMTVPSDAEIEVTSLGYEKSKVKVSFPGDTLRIFLNPSATALEEVVIKPKKQKYSKKNNPAVELMRRVREDKDKVNPEKSDVYSFDKYDKVLLAVNDYKGYMPGEDGKVKGKVKVLSELVDTAAWTGKRILDLSLKESVSTHIFTADGVDKEIITARRSNGIDNALDENYTRVLLEDILRDVDVYDNDIPVMRNRFVSPLSSISADFYKFHITDTVMIGNDRCVELTFAPHNPESMGFNGRLYVPVDDSVKYVRRVTMRLPKAANVNYVENMMLNQTFRKDSTGKVLKTMDDLVVELHVTGTVGRLHLSRQSRLDNHSFKKRDDLADFYNKLGNTFVIDEADDRTSDFWSASRMIPLSYAESKLAVKESPFRRAPVIYWTMKAVEIIIKGYVTTGKNSKFDFGPLDTFVSYNATEGLRLAVGGLSTANLSDHLFGRGYVAYGIKDHRWKYNAEIEYSFNKKKYHSREFPMNGIRASYKYDVNKLGQHYMTNSASNLLNSVKRLESNLTTYERLAQLEYNREWMNNFSINVTLSNQRQESSRYVPFVNGYGAEVHAYTQNNLRLQTRWAPGEKFMQTYNERRAVNRDAICLILTHTFGPKKLFGSEFTMNLTEFCLQKRFWFSVFGYADIVFKAAKLWNQVQFPALLWQNANVAYTVQTETFSLLNPMEFAMDQYVSLDLNYNLNGLLFNRIPLIKKLGLREVISFKGFYGNLTRKNNPEFNPDLFRFPDPGTSIMGRSPYIELGVGIDNILTFLRLDYIWRLSYRHKPGAPDSGLRFSFHFAF